jgi:hypothetical protein
MNPPIYLAEDKAISHPEFSTNARIFKPPQVPSEPFAWLGAQAGPAWYRLTEP